MDTGLIKRHGGEYSLTRFGEVVYDSQMIIGKALTYYKKLKAIEEIEMLYGATISKEELAQLINALIDSDQIKDSIMKPMYRKGDSTVLSSKMSSGQPPC